MVGEARDGCATWGQVNGRIFDYAVMMGSLNMNVIQYTRIIAQSFVVVVPSAIFAEAIEDCHEALRENPDNATVYSNRSGAHLMIGEIDLAVADLGSAIHLSPMDPVLHYNRGLLHVQKRRYAEAVRSYTLAIQLNPAHAFAYNNRGVAFEHLGELDKAIADYRKAVELVPSLKASHESLRRLRAN